MWPTNQHFNYNKNLKVLPNNVQEIVFLKKKQTLSSTLSVIFYFFGILVLPERNIFGHCPLQAEAIETVYCLVFFGFGNILKGSSQVNFGFCPPLKKVHLK
jgi:hypothetical protein